VFLEHSIRLYIYRCDRENSETSLKVDTFQILNTFELLVDKDNKCKLVFIFRTLQHYDKIILYFFSVLDMLSILPITCSEYFDRKNHIRCPVRTIEYRGMPSTLYINRRLKIAPLFTTRHQLHLYTFERLAERD